MGWRLIALFLLLPLLADCASVPVHTVCQLDLSRNGAECTRTDNTKETFFKPLSQLDGYIMRTPRDEQAIIEWAKRNCSK